MASEAESFEGLHKQAQLAMVHAIPGSTLGAIVALQVQDDLYGSREVSLPRRDPREAAGVAACNA